MSKDIVAQTQAIIDWMETEQGKSLLGTLKRVLGETRRAESKIVNRFYVPKISKGSD